MQTFSDEYKEGVNSIVAAITKLGNKLGTERYQEVHEKAQGSYDDAERQILEGEQLLAESRQKLEDGEQQLADGQRQIEEGEQQLASGKQDFADQQVSTTQQLADAYRQLSEGQAKYDAGVEQYNTAAELYNQLSSKFNAVRGAYDLFVRLVEGLQSALDNLESENAAVESAFQAYKDEVAQIEQEARQEIESAGQEDEGHKARREAERAAAWTRVFTAYDYVREPVSNVKSLLGQLSQPLESVGNAVGMPLSVDDRSAFVLAELSTPEGLQDSIDRTHRLVNDVRSDIDRLTSASITVNGVTVALMDVPGGLDLVGDQLASSKEQLDDAKAQLDSKWAEYNDAKSQFDQKVAEAQATIDDKQRLLDDSKAKAEQGQKDLESNRALLEEKTKELEEGKAKLEEGKTQLDKLKKYEWVVSSRLENGGIQGATTVSDMMLQMRWAMASLFIVVGLFVCYSAISRLVHEQGVQIGTKKALGFREGEIARLYLLFSCLAVLLGVVVSVAIAMFMVEGIVIARSGKQFETPPFGPHFSLVDVLALGGLEMALILLATWFAIHGMLKRNAIELLKGESTANVKEHFYERTKLWQRMSLYSQTIVNNCVNDKRRVAGTLVGVIGCTTLIVMAVTLSSNVSRSLEKHYADVYSFDAVVYLEDQSEESAKAVSTELYDRGVMSTPVFKRSMQVRKNDGIRAVATLVVPTNEDSFDKLYHVKSIHGDRAHIENGGLWVSAAYGEHMGVKEGDEITLTDEMGKTHTFTIAGFMEYYLMRHEFVLSQREYREAFGEVPHTNAMLVNTGGVDVERLKERLSEVEGYGSLVNDREDVSYSFGEIESVLKTTVYIYLVLSALMALIVLLNLDVMFVSEKKRELIVLMINGFSTKDAKAYIYRDSIVLTVIGILLGIVLGSFMGGITVAALEPDLAYYHKGFNEIAALIGAVGAGTFAVAVLLYALRMIPRFNLTDINRF
jgi:putative ABC transport system permease protein